MKYCEEYAALLDPFLDGELSASEAERVRTHLACCPGCRTYVQAALAIRDAFPEIEDTAVPDGFAETVCAAIRADAAPQKRRKTPWTKVLLPLAACCAIVVLVQHTLPFAGSGNSPAAADTAFMTAADDAGDAAVSSSSDETASPESEMDGAPAEAPETAQVPDTPAAAEENTPTAYTAGKSSVSPESGAALQNGYGAVDSGVAEGAPSSNDETAPIAPDAPILTITSTAYFAELTLTAEQAGTLLDSYTTTETPVIYNLETGLTETVYELTREQFDTLLSQLDEDVAYTENSGGDLARVTVTAPSA